MSELRTNRIIPRDGLTSGTGIGGGVIQVKSTTKTDTFVTTSTSFVDITGLSVTITPTRADSKILVTYHTNASMEDDGYRAGLRLMRDSTAIKVGDASSNRSRVTGQWHHVSGDQYDTAQVAGTHMDSPATASAVTYKMQVGTPYSTSYDLRVNYQGDDTDAAWVGRTASSITVMEISG